MMDNPWIVAILILLIAGALVSFVLTPVMIFLNTIVHRVPLKKRTRKCTNTKDEQQMMMFAEGIKWAEQFKDKTHELHLVNDGLNLYGEYIDLGFDRCAVVLQGRTESLLYSYYFSDVYARAGYNILVIDVRAHGISEGIYQTAGIRESDDLVQWIKLIKEKYGMESFLIHGVCVGGATGIYTYVKLKNQGLDYVKALVTDGLFYSYYEIFKQNFKMRKKPVFPILHLVFFLAMIFARVNLYRETPIKYMKDIDIPILFIWSVKDIFCIKSKGEKLYEACASPKKRVRFFPEGRHSHVRSSQPEEYDKEISDFLKEL